MSPRTPPPCALSQVGRRSVNRSRRPPAIPHRPGSFPPVRRPSSRAGSGGRASGRLELSMRGPSLRVAVVAIAAVAVFAVGSLVTRNGPLGGSGEADGVNDGTTTAAGSAATTATTSLASLGTLSERIERLPAVAPGDLHGVLDLG